MFLYTQKTFLRVLKSINYITMYQDYWQEKFDQDFQDKRIFRIRGFL